jgi:predicted ATPase/class 3 adenylate cyclase
VLVNRATGTPDDEATAGRLRVLVSSNLEELAAERDAARTAIESLHLTAVLAQPGAVVPAPTSEGGGPADGTDIFVGIYWQEYGWHSPEGPVSAIEQEWSMAGDRPRLVYVKEASPERAAALATLIDRIQASQPIVYRRFGSSGELAELLVEDLAKVVSLNFRPGSSPRWLPEGTVSFLIVDLADSTPLVERLGTGYREVLEKYRGIVATAVTEHGGAVVETEGDGILCAFAAAGPALSAAVQVTGDMEATSWPDDERVVPRIGVHAGAVHRVGESYFGVELHRAFRIAAVANGGQIVASAVARQLGADSENGWRFDDLGSYGLKGLSHTERIFQVVAPGMPASYPPLRGRRVDTMPLPSPLTSLVGRHDEREEVSGLLAQGCRLVTLTGPGGIGKTRLALAVAEQVAGDYPDGSYFVALAGVDDASQVLPTVAATLGVPAAAPGRDLAVLSDFLGARRALLVLDNFEQVTDAAPRVVDLVSHNPGIVVIVTSRVPLRVGGEREYQVGPLDIPAADAVDAGDSAAVQLFVARATAVQHGFTLTADNTATIIAICRALDGLPLAIELAAARIRILSPASLLERLGNRLDVLTGGPTDAPDRHRTLRAAIQWSVDLLSAEERTAFARLGVFDDSADLTAVDNVVAGDIGDGLALIESLADKSLVTVDADTGGEPRVRLLGVLAEFARSELEASGEADIVRRRHAEHYQSWLEKMAQPLRGPQQDVALDICELDHANLMAAMEWFGFHGRHDDLMLMERYGWPYFLYQAHAAEVADWLYRTDAATLADPVNRGWHHALIAGFLLEMGGDYEEAIRLSGLARATFESTDDRVGLAWANLISAGSLSARELAVVGDSVTDHILDAIDLFQATDDLWGEAYAYNFLGGASAFQGRFDEAIRHLGKSLDLSKSLGVDILIGQCHNWLAMVYLAMARRDEARDQLRAALVLLEARYHLEGRAYTLEATSGWLLGDGNATQAMTLFGAASEIRDNIGMRPWPMAQVFLSGLADLASSTPNLTAACGSGRQLSPEAAVKLATSLLT